MKNNQEVNPFSRDITIKGANNFCGGEFDHVFLSCFTKMNNNLFPKSLRTEGVFKANYKEIFMKILQKFLLPILILTLILLFFVKSEKDELQRNIDLTFTNAISDSMSGLSKDYSKLSNDEKIQCYYQTFSNLKDAMEVFYVSSYKEYDNLFQEINHLYIYLLDNHNENYEIDNKLYIIEFLGKVLVYPNDEQLISDFKNFLNNK